METIQSENEMELNEQNAIETLIEEVSSEQQPEENTESNDAQIVDEQQKQEEILRFRDQLLAREILSSGVNISDKIVHFGAGYKNQLIWDYLSAIKQQNLVQEMEVIYTAVDVDAEAITAISKKNAEEQTGIDLRLVNNTMQSFIDTNTDEFDWSIITGIFDTNLYGEEQFQFLDKIISSLLNYSKEGLIFTFDSSKEKDENYGISQIINYVSSLYNRYRINRINEENYIICIYKYYHSIIPQ
jgi:hypothetical protein